LATDVAPIKVKEGGREELALLTTILDTALALATEALRA